MISFASDYIKGCHPRILEKLMEINDQAFAGYCTDTYCESAEAKIREAIGCPEAVVRFICGGTLTNQLVIDTMLDMSEGVVAVETGHIATHESGAIESVGRKVLTIPQHDGLMDPEELKTYLKNFYADSNHSHMVYPGMVYISFSSEVGTIYSYDALKSISETCHEYGMSLYIDGARLGYGLAASKDVTIKDIAELADVFYIGGTKIGALFGEAVVFTKGNVPKRFTTKTKQHGALLAKGWIAGVQFDTLFSDDLYMQMSLNAIEKAEKLKKIMLDAGFREFISSPTNQQFFIVNDSVLKLMEEKLDVRFWEKYDETHTVIRMVTSFSTTDADIEALEEIIKEIN